MNMRRIVVCAVAAFTAAAGLIAAAPAQAGPPQCDSGPVVQYDCPAGDLCTGVIDGQCLAPVPPMLPPPPPVRVGIEGGIGVGI